RHLQERDGQVRGKISIGIFETLSPYVIPLILTKFRRKHPLVELEFHEEDHDELIEKLQLGAYDVALTYLDPEPPSNNLSQQTITTRNTHVLMHQGHHLAHEKSLSLTEIESEPLILLGQTPSRDNTLRLLGITINHPRV